MKKKNYKTELNFDGNTIKLECTDFTSLSLFLIHLCNSLNDSAEMNDLKGFVSLAESDTILHDATRAAYDDLRTELRTNII